MERLREMKKERERGVSAGEEEGRALLKVFQVQLWVLALNEPNQDKNLRAAIL